MWNILLLASEFVQLPRASSIFYPLQLFHFVFFAGEVYPLQAMWSSWCLGRDGSGRGLVNSWDSTIRPDLVFRTFWCASFFARPGWFHKYFQPFPCGKKRKYSWGTLSGSNRHFSQVDKLQLFRKNILSTIKCSRLKFFNTSELFVSFAISFWKICYCFKNFWKALLCLYWIFVAWFFDIDHI